MEKDEIFPINPEWIKKSLAWAEDKFPFLAYFDPNSIAFPHDGFQHVLFAGEESMTLEEIKYSSFNQEKIGILGYDLKNAFEALQSCNRSLVDCPESLFFTPILIIKFQVNHAEIFSTAPKEVIQEITAFRPEQKPSVPIKLFPCTSKKEYIHNVKQIQNHIQKGDIYEMNYCLAFQAFFNSIDPVHLYFKLRELSPMPFSVFFKAEDKYVIGASPERFLKKFGKQIIAQPIKGTIRRGNSPEEDQKLRQSLQNNEKERAENLMIVDLMRNDLSKISLTGSVKVEELFGIYSFAQVTQMISTVSSTLNESILLEEIIKNTFPMGSMTGAPKIRCMELIDHYENFKRGWFSGSIGYLSPNQDFDFNVVIRSIILDKSSGKLFFAVGSAITYDSDPEQEFEECMLEAKPLFEVLQA